MYPKTIPLKEINAIVEIVTKGNYKARAADFTYACWWTAGWYAYKKVGPSKLGDAAPGVRKAGQDKHLEPLDLRMALLKAEGDLQNDISRFESGDALAVSEVGNDLMKMLDWVQTLLKLLAFHIPV